MHNVLLIDFDKRSRETFANKINWTQHGFHLNIHDRSFSSILSACKNNHYDVMVMNLKNSQMRGLDLCKTIRHTSNIPIILIGGSTDFHFVRETIRLQIFDYLPAPLTLEEFIKSLLSLKQTLKQETIHKKHKRVQDTFGYTRKNVANIIDEVKKQVEISLHRHITLKEIADQLHYNCSYLGQKFKSYEGMTFPEYVLSRRMEMAKYLLSNTELKIYEIAAEVGFTDVDWFYKKFKMHTGVTASSFRKQRISSKLSSFVV